MGEVGGLFVCMESGRNVEVGFDRADDGLG